MKQKYWGVSVTHSTTATSSPLGRTALAKRSESSVLAAPSADVFLHQNRRPLFKSGMTDKFTLRACVRNQATFTCQAKLGMHRQGRGRVTPCEPYFTLVEPTKRSVSLFCIRLTWWPPWLVLRTSQPGCPTLLVIYNIPNTDIQKQKAPKIMLENTVLIFIYGANGFFFSKENSNRFFQK